jgi:hypothetical protein
MNDFANWVGEIHVKDNGVEITRAIATHLAMRIRHGDAVIVCRNPLAFSSAFSKRWKTIIQKVEKERATKIGGSIKGELTSYIDDLKAIKFVAGEPRQRNLTTVWLLDPDEAAEIPSHVMSIYVMTDASPEQLSFWADNMPDGGIIQTYRKSSFSRIREDLQ